MEWDVNGEGERELGSLGTYVELEGLGFPLHTMCSTESAKNGQGELRGGRGGSARPGA